MGVIMFVILLAGNLAWWALTGVAAIQLAKEFVAFDLPVSAIAGPPLQTLYDIILYNGLELLFTYGGADLPVIAGKAILFILLFLIALLLTPTIGVRGGDSFIGGVIVRKLVVIVGAAALMAASYGAALYGY